MKVLQVTCSSKGGAGIAALRLHNALQENNVQSAYVSVNLTINFENKEIVDPFFFYKKPSLLQKIVNKIVAIIKPTRRSRIIDKVHKYKKVAMDFELFSSPFSTFRIEEHPLFKEADIINLHWVSGVIDYSLFFKNCKKPIVWTLHDMNPFSGVFHYKNDSLNNSTEINKFNKLVKELQKKNINKIKKGTIVSPSKWLLDEADQSGFFPKFKKVTIANSIDTSIFKIQDKNTLRKKYSIPKDEFTVLFVADNINNYRKGFDLLVDSLTYLEKLPMTIITIGQTQSLTNNNIKTISFGKVTEIEKLVEIYGLADVFVLPSREDNLPNVILESFSVGLPVISFNVGGIKEHVLPNKTGFISENLTGESLAKTINEFYDCKSEFDARYLRHYAENNFNFKNQYLNYFEVYKELLCK
ncbi:MAG: glycosyltransferase [Polaribacter sp.]|uniref:glycosyltransferase n=1 Tax=Polaribacter sp. TaxID=1920175 RepID=UPI003EF5B0E5